MSLWSALISTQQKIPGSVKKWKVPGINCITTVNQKLKKNELNEEVKPTMVDFNNKVLNEFWIDRSIWIVKMTGRLCGWNQSKRNIILLKIKKVTGVNMTYNKTALYFAPLQFIRQEWSVAPSIFNIKAWGLAQCILWLLKLG